MLPSISTIDNISLSIVSKHEIRNQIPMKLIKSKAKSAG